MDVHAQSCEWAPFSINCQVYFKTSAGYDNDSVNGEVLMTRLSVSDGRLVLLTFAVRSSWGFSVLFESLQKSE